MQWEPDEVSEAHISNVSLFLPGKSLLKKACLSCPDSEEEIGLQHWLEFEKAQAKISGSLFIKANAKKKLILDLDKRTQVRKRVPF